MDWLARWSESAGAELGVDAAAIDRELVLGLAREVRLATSVRQAAVVSAYLVGVAVGRGMPATEAAATLSALAKEWPSGGYDWRD